MEKLSGITRFHEAQNIILEGFDPVSAGGFTQVPNFILNNPELSFAAKVVYAKLLSYAWDNNRVFPGQDTMAEEVGTSQPTVARAINELQQRGLLAITRRGQGKTNLYVLKYTVQQKKRG
jgi:DNA-binding MarR family transcriptional regulator